jgi:hypothetical protein
VPPITPKNQYHAGPEKILLSKLSSVKIVNHKLFLYSKITY